ncbi:hypothetical protein [Alienimonas chondri]|uniref:hypothetical protein n=1 Tax=Alienimonas chondri TaxID=2681879 RepID=UPI00148989C3|nr:hypothetical protein [Alienimonas chondri]
MPTPAEVRKQVTRDLIVSPWTLIPAALGGVALMIGVAGGGDPTWLIAGAGGFMAGGGMLATRWLTQLEDVTQNAWRKLVDAEKEDREEELDKLDRELQRDGDPSSQKLLRALRTIRQNLQQDEAAGKLGGAGGIVKDRAEEVFVACIAQLRHSLELDETARRLAGPARKELRDDRQAILKEVAETVRHLAKTVTEVREAPIKRREGNLSRLRAELDATMEVARRTEARLNELDSGPGRVRE